MKKGTQTKVMQTKKEIEYPIRVVDNISNPSARDELFMV